MKIIKRIIIITLLSLIIFATGFVGVLTLLEYKPEDIEIIEVNNNAQQKIQLDQTLSVMTFNIGYAGLGAKEDFVMDGGTKGRPNSKEVVSNYLEGIQSIIDTYPSDIYLFQEVDLKSRRSYRINQVQTLHDHVGSSYASMFAYNFKSWFVPFPLSVSQHIGYVESGLQTLLPYEVESAKRYQFPGSFSWPLRVANLKRAMLVSYLPIEGSDKQLIIVNLHMSAYDHSGELRNQEMQFLKTFMEQASARGDYVIIGGDFNQTFPDAAGVFDVETGYYEAFLIEADYLPSGFSWVIDHTTATCRLLNQPYQPGTKNTFYYIIDGFIVSDNIEVLPWEGISEVTSALTLDLDFENSDHNPVIMRIKLKP